MLRKPLVIFFGLVFVLAQAQDDERFTDTEQQNAKRPTTERNPFADHKVPDDFKEIQQILADERKGNKIYDSTWKIAEKQFQQKKQQNPGDFDPKTPDECYIAVIAYTQGGRDPLHKDFNTKFKALTDQASWDGFAYKSFFYLLNRAIPGIKNDPDPKSVLFRGIKNWHMPADPKAGDVFYFDYFASTSTDRAKAEHFLGPEGTFVQIDGGAEVAIGISKYSRFDEKEVLVFPQSKFKVKRFDKKDPKKHQLVIERA